jgi:hypothetical protein
MAAKEPGGGLAMALEAARLAASLGAGTQQLPTTLEQALYSQLLASGQLGDSLSALAAAGARQTHNPQLGAGLGGGGSYGGAQPGGGGGNHHDDLVGSMGGRAGGRTRSSDSRSSSAYASRHQAAEQRRRTRINER